MPSFRSEVSQALDTFSQNEGAILVRQPEGWRALEKPGPDHVLATDENGTVVWIEGGGGAVIDTGWIDITPDSPWEVDPLAPGAICKYRVVAKTGFAIGRVRDDTGQMTGSIITLPAEYRPKWSFWSRSRSGNSRRDMRLNSNGQLFIISAPAKWCMFSITWAVEPDE